MINDKEISVILPVYNGASFLELSILSVINQRFKNCEFIICNDASTDNSLQILNDLASKYPNQIKILNNEVNLGLFKTLNKLIENSSAPLIHLWAQDDIMKPECLHECMLFHDQNPNVSMSYHTWDFIDENGKIIPDGKIDGTPTIISKHQYANTSIRWGCMAGNISNVTLNRKYLEKTGLFDESLIVSGDFDLFTKLAEISDIGFNNKKLVFVRRHLEQLSKAYNSIFYRIKEDIPINLKLIGFLEGKEKKKAFLFWTWKIQSAYFNDWLFLLRKGQKKEANKVSKLLRSITNFPLLFMRWIILRFLRLIKLDIFLYNKF